MKNRSLKRLIVFIVFLVPVAWYLFLQLFGSNSFSLALLSEYPEGCDAFIEICIVSKNDSLSVVESNYMSRVSYGADKRNISIVKREQLFFDCVNQSDADFVLVSKDGIWGGYSLDREGVDQLLTELDILTLQESYGKGSSR